MGYEFLKDQTKRRITSKNGELTQKFTCKPQGCKFTAAPSMKTIDIKNNIEFVGSFCDPAYLSGYCKPDTSYVDFKCKEGYELDTQFGFLKVKCLNSYLWDTIPLCKDVFDLEWSDNFFPPKKKSSTTTSSTTTRSTTTTTTTTPTTTSTTTTTTPTTTSTTTTTPTTTSTTTTTSSTTPLSKTTTVNNLTTTTSTTMNRLIISTTIFQNTTSSIINYCSSSIPKPSFFNSSLVKYEVKNNTKDLYFPGSKVIYECLLGYFSQNMSRTVEAICESNGNWILKDDCKIHKCWSNLPKRPLNGRRSVGLVLNSLGYTNRSVVNFTCDEYFYRVGRSQLMCIKNEWEKDVPECKLREDICRIKPASLDENTFLKSLTRVEAKYELSYQNSTTLTIYTHAMYICMPGYYFQNARSTGYRYFNTTFYPYQNVSCIGQNKWQTIPKCIN
ncbi:unnamed protein product [Brachionus calyciflorus]|uniref:Sushi domain-containing protein n=1 Tax=Brachionus calyciflorus TaxID=104777 RepID=A0A813ZLD3_9BILA|nr:unnamed protein product [Brachionus calyciflorus]